MAAAPKLPRGARSRILFRIMRTYMKPYWKRMLLVLVLMLSANAFALVGPWLSGQALNAIADRNGVRFGDVYRTLAWMAAFYLASALLSYLVSRLMVGLGQRIAYRMREDVFDKLMKMPVGYFDRNATGDIVSRISYDIDTINASLSNDLLQILASLVTVIGSLVMMAVICPILLVVFAVTVPISLLFTRYKSKKIRPLFSRRSAKLGELNGYAEEMLSGQKSIKAYTREEVITGRFDRYNEEACQAYYRADYQAAIIGPTVNFINNLSLVLITTLGGMLYMFTVFAYPMPAVFQIEIGAVGSFVQYSRKFTGPINEFANIINEIHSALSAGDRVFRLLDEEEEVQDVPGAEKLEDVCGDVALSHVRFGYTPERVVLGDLSLDVRAGQTIAIVGPTGAGKTTIINLLMRFYDPQSGRICLDGRDLRDCTMVSVRRSYTMVLQDTWLFYGTIRDNIRYGHEEATEEEIRAAAKAAHIDSYIESLPDGYGTILSDDGVNISKGQKQMLTIARAMLLRSPLLILDEATSNVDSRTEMQIRDSMEELMKDRTCFIIAHRLSTIEKADQILVVKDGDVIERGTHRELLSRPTFYRDLYRSQFETSGGPPAADPELFA